MEKNLKMEFLICMKIIAILVSNNLRDRETMKREREAQCDQIKIANFYKSCPSMISLEKCMILTTLQKLHKNVDNNCCQRL